MILQTRAETLAVLLSVDSGYVRAQKSRKKLQNKHPDLAVKNTSNLDAETIFRHAPTPIIPSADKISNDRTFLKAPHSEI